MAEAPRTLAGYQILERVAVGGMAEIFRAVRSGPGKFRKPVAIKMVLPDLGRDPQFVQMFLEEARLGAALSSPHLVQVFDFGEEGGTYYLAMEYVDGIDLSALLGETGPLALPLGLHLGGELCAALRDLHGAVDAEGRPLHIVHRDVNPGNVLLSSGGDVKLGDFGIAKARARSLRTERGVIKGKLAYLAPEQVRGEEVDGRADLYAVGLILFEALTGQRYLEASTDAALLRIAAAPGFRPPSMLRADLPAWLDRVLERALAPEAARRYPDAETLREALRSAGAPGDPADLRRQLGELVRRSQGEPRAVEAATVSPAPRAEADAVSPAPRAEPPLRTETSRAEAPLRTETSRAELSRAAGRADRRPGTEVLSAPPSTRRTLLRWGGALLGVTVLGTGAIFVARLRGEDVAGLGLDGGPAALRSIDLRPWAAAPDAALLDRRDAAAGSRLDASPRRRGRARRPDGQTGQVLPRRPSDLGPPAAARRPATLPELAELDRTLQDRGILFEDAPQLWAERSALERAVARGEGDRAVAVRLLERARALPVDRAFVDAKLQRITSRLERARLDPGVGEELKQRTRRALSHAVTGRYAEANRELNAIRRRLEP